MVRQRTAHSVQQLQMRQGALAVCESTSCLSTSAVPTFLDGCIVHVVAGCLLSQQSDPRKSHT